MCIFVLFGEACALDNFGTVHSILLGQHFTLGEAEMPANECKMNGGITILMEQVCFRALPALNTSYEKQLEICKMCIHILSCQ